MKRLVPLVAGALAAASFSAVLAEAPSGSAALADLYDSLRAPRVTGSLAVPERLTIGHAEIRPGPGARLLQLSAGDQPCGWVLDGPATLLYRVEDRFSVPIAEHNLERAHGVEVARTRDGLSVSTTLEGAAAWGWGFDLGEVADTEAPPTPPGWLRELLDGKLTDNPERDMLRAHWNGDTEYRWALFHAKSDDFYEDLDARTAVGSEFLGRFDKLAPGSGPYSGRLSTEEMATQPVGRGWLDDPPFEFMAVDHTIDLRSEAREHVEVNTRSKYVMQIAGLRLLQLGLWDETYDDHQHRHDYTISRLLVNGAPAPYLHRWGSLYVELPRPSQRGEILDLEISVAGDVLEQPEGNNYWRLLGNWYPQPARDFAEMAEVRFSMDVPAPWIPIAPGEIVERSSSNGRNRVRTELKGPMTLLFVVAGKYHSFTEESDGSRVNVSMYATVKEKEAQRLARIALAVRGCLERWLGVPYPFQDLEMVEVNDWGWGQAPAGMIFITKEAFLTPALARIEGEAISGRFTRGVNERIAHEVAHGWFPHVAKVPRIEEAWLSESLADYTSAYCLTDLMSKGQAKYHWKRQLDQWKYWSKQAGDEASVFLARHVAFTEDDARNWQYLNYGRGPLILQAVREKLEKKYGEEKGEQMFLTWIRSYVKTFEFKYAETRHLIGILDQITGEKWMPFFERYLLGTETPEVD